MLIDVVRDVQESVLGRDDVIEGIAMAIIAGEHVMIFGPPGCAKSLLVREICKRITGANLFDWLMTKFTTPEEVFGPMKVSKLLKDEYERNISGKLPEAHLGFLDEIWKSSSAILNTLLTLANERVFHNGNGPVQVPLLSLIGASNEPPQEEGLGVLYDRFLLRFWTRYLPSFYLPDLLQITTKPVKATMTFADLEILRNLLYVVKPGPDIIEGLIHVLNDLRTDGFVLSDRRITKIPTMMASSAVLHSRKAVTEEDAVVLPYVLSNTEADQKRVREVTAKYFTSKRMVAKSKFESAIAEFHAAPVKPKSREERKVLAVAAEAIAKIARDLRLLDDAAGTYPQQVEQLVHRLEERTAESLQVKR